MISAIYGTYREPLPPDCPRRLWPLADYDILANRKVNRAE